MSISRVLSAQLPDVFCYHLKSTGTQKSFSTIVTCISCHAKTKWNSLINTKTQICFLQKRFIGENDFGSGNVSKPTIRITIFKIYEVSQVLTTQKMQRNNTNRFEFSRKIQLYLWCETRRVSTTRITQNVSLMNFQSWFANH